MSFINPSDMVEEDAADLQFPKESQHEDNFINIRPNAETKYTYLEYNNNNTFHEFPINCAIFNNANKYSTNYLELCNSCQNILQAPHIKCAECPNILLCPKCFANGAEINKHQNTHSYIICHDNIEIFYDTNWTLADEHKLLELLIIWGYGNWDDISRGFQYKYTPTECQQHYHNCYFNGIFTKKMGLTNDYYFPEHIPYLYKLKSIDPPRFDDVVDNINFNNMSGYRSARGDFDIPYDRSAETTILNIIDMNDYDDSSFSYDNGKWLNKFGKIDDDLKCAVFKAYNNRINERQRRYKIMHDNGLLLPSKSQGWLSKYYEALKCELPLSNNRKYCSFNNGKFIVFMQLVNGIAFDSLIESLQYYAELKKYFYNLCDFRTNGIITMAGAKIYNRLKRKRLQEYRDIKMNEKIYDWRIFLSENDEKKNNAFNFLHTTFTQPRKKAAPIEIIGFSGYDKLTEDEKQLCSIHRILPKSFLEFKNILKTENSKIGYLRLADARRLIKIDVNKTRQLYDFLLDHGHINKPNN